MDELLYETLKTAITSDLLSSNNINISNIRVMIVEDRNYDIPEWMFKYLQDDDINSMIINHLNNDRDNYRFIEFLKVVIGKGLIKNYKYLTMTIMQYEGYDLVYLFDDCDIYKYLKMFKSSLSENDIIDMIKSYTSRGLTVPLNYVYLYISVSVSPVWYVRSRKLINQKLDELLDKMETPEELDCIYPILYQSCVFNMKYSKYTYMRYLSNGGTWCIDCEDAEALYEYIAFYCVYDKPRNKPMDPNIKKVLFNVDKRKNLFDFYDEEELKLMIMESVIKNVDNIEFIYWDISAKQLEMLRTYFDVYENSVPKNLDKVINLLYENVSIDYTGIDKLILRYVEFGSDIKRIIPYIKFVATKENISELIAKMSEQDIITIGQLNPVIHSRTNMTFLDMVMENISSLSSSHLDKVKRAFSNSASIYNALYNTEKQLLYWVNKEFHGVCSIYPGVLVSDINLSSIDVHEIYKKNHEVISYIQPELLKDGLVYNHIMTHGYVKLHNINKEGLEQLLNLTQIFQLLDKGVGYGHLLDFKNMGYINISIMYILRNIDK